MKPKRTYTRAQVAALTQEAMIGMELGSGQNAMSRELGVAASTLSHWLKKLEAAEGNYKLAFDGKKAKGGRPHIFNPSADEVLIARWYRLTKESVFAAAHFFSEDERVSYESRGIIVDYLEDAEARKGRPHWPDSVIRAFHVSHELKAAFRGKKHLQQVEMISLRGMFYLTQTGEIELITPGHVWELDDYSTNQPYTYIKPGTGEVSIGRQILGARDLASASWLGFEHIGRERDAYRGEDILRYIEKLVRSHGLPAILRLERGIWEKSCVHGIEVKGLASRWGDLRDIMQIEHVFKSKSKAIIEGGFNPLQRWLGHTGLDIGRFRGEFEEATKRLRQAKNKGTDPLTLGFLTQEESSRCHHVAAKKLNSLQMMRAHLNERISPDDLMAREGWKTQPLHEKDAWRFLPCKEARTVRSGHVTVNPGGGWPKLHFTVNGITEGVYLETGYRVLVACDPANPHKGAYICNAERGGKNTKHLGVGEYILTASYLGLAPQFNFSEELSPHLVARRNSSAAANTEFKAVTSVAAQKPHRQSTAMDGNGNSREVTTIDRGEVPSPAPTITPAGSRETVPPEVSSLAVRDRHLDTHAKRQAEIKRLKESLAAGGGC